MIKKKLTTILTVACLLTALTMSAAESISGGQWHISANKGELTGAKLGNTSVLKFLGKFQVIGKKAVRPFKAVSELRKQENGILIYEGISDDGKNQFVEFGAVIKTGNSLDFMLFMSWLPPGPKIPDAVEGIVEFSSAVKTIKETAIPKSDTVIPGTCDFLITLKNGANLRMRLQGLNKKKIKIGKNNHGKLIMKFEERRDYLTRKYKLEKTKIANNYRLLEYWVRNIDTHFIQFTFSKI